METAKPLTVGVISDTHGLLRPQAIAALEGADMIVHAGDIGKPSVLEALQKLAPRVEVVRGNIDKGEWAKELADIRLVQIGQFRLYLLHNLKELNLYAPKLEDCDVIISGHSHQPRVETKNGILYLNPGSAGPRRFKLPISLGRLSLQAKKVEAQIVELQL